MRLVPNVKLMKKRLTVFAKFHSTQVLLIAAGVAAGWQAADSAGLLSVIYQDFPLLDKAKAYVFFASFAVAFYKARMNAQVVQRSDLPTVVAETAPVPAAEPPTAP